MPTSSHLLCSKPRRTSAVIYLSVLFSSRAKNQPFERFFLNDNSRVIPTSLCIHKLLWTAHPVLRNISHTADSAQKPGDSIALFFCALYGDVQPRITYCTVLPPSKNCEHLTVISGLRLSSLYIRDEHIPTRSQPISRKTFRQTLARTPLLTRGS